MFDVDNGMRKAAIFVQAP